MCKIEASPATLKKVKGMVDFIYEITIGEGYKGSLAKSPTRERYIMSILVKRGIVVKEGDIKNRVYRWVAPLPPTKTLYKTIGDEMVANEMDMAKRSREKKAARSAKPVEGEKEAPVQVAGLEGFSDQALWDELKKRGYAIEDGRLVVVTKSYLN